MTEGQKKQKKKVTKMALSDFLSDPSTGSWADEMDDLPSAPAAVSSQDDYSSRGFGGDRGGRGFSGRGFGDREEPRFQPRAPVDLPTRPPYTIHLGNLPFDATESDIQGFFMASQITSIRIMKDFEDKPKGFGYVEFDSLDSLKKALENNGQSLCGRNVRVSVAEPPREREVREDRTTSEWRRDAPIPPAGGSRFGNDRGDRFAERGDRAGPRGDREFGSRFNNSERPPDRTDAGSWRREAPLPPTEGRPGWEKPREREHRDTSWGGGNSGFTSRAPPAPAARKKLELKPRSAEAAAVSTENKPAKASPFGAAKPVDSEEALRRVEERLQQEKKDAAEKARKEKESKREKKPEAAPEKKEEVKA
ncbi:hypothetical protein BGZ74_008688 [Mortierella antarctica]|nr:hypothetical protein BGZ74_008688 [Mortierella antarctica]